MRMVVHARLRDEGDASAELAVSLRDDARVFVPGHYFIGVAINVQQRDVRSGEWREIVHGILGVSASLLIRFETVSSEHELPIAIASLALPEAARPAFEIAHGGVSV